jgi:hypothetical protein
VVFQRIGLTDITVTYHRPLAGGTKNLGWHRAIRKGVEGRRQ